MKKSIVTTAIALSLFSTGISTTSVLNNPITVNAKQTKNNDYHYQKSSQIKLQGAVNVRDLGGYKNSNGQTIKKNKLIRSAKLNSLTQSDQKKLIQGHHLGIDVDLRTPDEMKNLPDVKMKGVKFIPDPVYSNKTAQKNNQIQQKNGQKGMEDTYSDFINTQQGKDAYKKLFHQLLNVPDNKAVLWHCSAGKDRAGFGTALVLTALGFNKQDIYHDYLQSNYYRKDVNAQDINNLKKKGASKQQIQSAHYGDIVETQYLDKSYQQATKHYGSINGYLHKGLGLSNQDIQKLQDKYLNK